LTIVKNPLCEIAKSNLLFQLRACDSFIPSGRRVPVVYIQIILNSSESHSILHSVVLYNWLSGLQMSRSVYRRVIVTGTEVLASLFLHSINLKIIFINSLVFDTWWYFTVFIGVKDALIGVPRSNFIVFLLKFGFLPKGGCWSFLKMLFFIR